MAKRIDIEGVIGWHDQATPEYLGAELKAANGEAVEIHINSPGGLVGAGLRMYNQIRDYQGETTAVLAGYAMSMASYIPQACNEVVAKDNAVYMIHNARGLTYGDHNEVLKYGNYLKGLSGISAREFVKQTTRRGKAKSLDEITAMMDNETFLFGPEMVDNGFVDSIIDSEGDSDKETALATAQAQFNEAMALMASDPGKVRADLQLAMQLFGDVDRPRGEGAPTQILTPPAATAAGTKAQEGEQMGLKALLAANPTAQADYDAAIAAAVAQGEKAGREEMQATVKAVSNFLNNPEYPKQVGEMALKVLNGEQTKASLESMVATADMIKEMQKGAEGATGTTKTGETQGQAAGETQVDLTQPVADASGLEALKSMHKGGN